ncbi:MAG TPA: DNA polymerase III subunit delta', partial [Isosphaeraceae bacterium]|nr:DNA polymerase III subunit delta' [Isosphaeraceae bacterium]
RLAALADGSLRRALGLADPDLHGFRRSMIDELAGDPGFDPPRLAHRLGEYVKQAGKETGDQRRRASLLVGELARFFRGVLWQTAGLAPSCPDVHDRNAAAALAGRLEPEDVFLLADRCLEADYHIRRRLALNLILESLLHDLGKVINAQGLNARR